MRSYYDVFPLVIPAGEVSVVRVKPRFEQACFPPAAELRVGVVPYDGTMPDGQHLDNDWAPFGEVFAPLEWRLDEQGVLVVRANFHGEQEHALHVQSHDGKFAQIFSVFSVKPDLFALRPFKGDVHVHTTRSDGKESPAYVAARYREEGFDFLAVTDHRKYEGSLEAIRYWSRHAIGLALYPGEEVHPPDCPVHIVNVGGGFGVTEKIVADEEAYRREVDARIPALGDVRQDVEPFKVASTEWAFDQIRSGGGLAVYPHPDWASWGRNVLSEAMADEILRRRKFDALELIGGYNFTRDERDSNSFQVLRYIEAVARGGDFPVVGASDGHGTDIDKLFNWYYTLVFAESADFPHVRDAVLAGRSVAVDAPANERIQCYGPRRLARYAHFLLRHYFPRHDELCRLEGQAMFEVLAGDDAQAAWLPTLAERVAAYRERAFAREDVACR